MCDRTVYHYATEIHLTPCAALARRRRSLDFQSFENITDSISNVFDMAFKTGMDGNEDGSGIDDLYPAVFECFAVIFLGYLAGKMGIITSSESKGLNTFIGTFSLPAIIFLSMAQLDLSSVNWKFLLAICMAKATIFLSVIVISLLVSKPKRLDLAGIYAIFCTQSNDFALGYPIVKALYSKTHPQYADYLYLVAPVNLIMLNPIAFTLMEIAKIKDAELQEQQTRSIKGPSAAMAGGSSSRGAIARRVLKGVLLNPVVLMTALGIAGNLAFQQCLPQVLEGILKVLGSAFSASALFSLGLTMVGSAASMKGSGFVVPGILIGIKLLGMPLIAREFVSLVGAGADVNETVSLSNYAFLYGTFPTAPGVFVYATHYDLAVQMIAGGMVACTFMSAPLMFVSAKMTTLTKLDPRDYVNDLDSFLFNMSILGLVASFWVMGVFVLSRKWKKVPHCITLCLVISQAIACCGAILWSYFGVSADSDWKLYLQFGVFAFGVFSSRIWTAILAASLVFLRCRSLCFVLKLRPFMGLIGWGIPAGLVMILMLTVKRETGAEKVDPNFQYGQTQALVAVMVLVITFIVTIGCLVMQKRYERQYAQYSAVSTSITGSNPNMDIESQADSGQESIPSTRSTSINSKRSVSLQDSLRSRGSNSCQPGPSGCKFNASNMSKPLVCVTEIEDLARPSGSGRRLRLRSVGHDDIQEESEDDEILFSYDDDLCSPTRHPCQTNQLKYCTRLLERYKSMNTLTEPAEIGIVRDRDDEFQMTRHIVMLLLLCSSMFVGIGLCLWTLIMEKVSGIYVELVFLDAALNCGQGFFTFMLFGLNTRTIVMPVHKWWRRMVYGEGSVHLPKWDELSAETKQICEQFITYHVDKCIQDIVRDRRWRMETYSQVFCGHELVDWLMLVGLARDRSEAVKYGRHLLNGRVICHIKNLHHFHDQAFFYKFQNDFE